MKTQSNTFTKWSNTLSLLVLLITFVSNSLATTNFKNSLENELIYLDTCITNSEGTGSGSEESFTTSAASSGTECNETEPNNSNAMAGVTTLTEQCTLIGSVNISAGDPTDWWWVQDGASGTIIATWSDNVRVFVRSYNNSGRTGIPDSNIELTSGVATTLSSSSYYSVTVQFVIPGVTTSYSVDITGTALPFPISTTTPTVTTTTASSISATTATLGGNVTDNGGDTVTERGIVYNTTGTPNVNDDTIVTIGSGDGSFSDEVTGLTAETQYYVRAYATNSEGTSYGSQESFTTSTFNALYFDDNAKVSGLSGINPTAFTVEFKLYLDSETTDWQGIYWSNDGVDIGIYLEDDNSVALWTTTNTSYKSDDALTYGAWNHVAISGGVGDDLKMYINGVEVTYSEPNGDPGAPILPTNNMTMGYGPGAYGSYELGDSALDDFRIWSEIRTQQQINDNKDAELTMPYPASLVRYYDFNHGIGGADNTGYTTLAERTGNGTDATLSGFNLSGNTSNWVQTTSLQPTVTTPTITTTAASGITTTTATLGGNVTDNGGDVVTERGIVYNTTGSPTTADTTVTIGSGDGSFSDEVTGLAAETQYYVRAYAINSEGTSYGSEETFTTLEEPVASGAFWSDDFENTGSPSSGIRTPSNNIGLGDPSTFYFKRTTNSQIDLSFGSYTNVHGTHFWAGENHGGLFGAGNEEQNIVFYNIDITGKTDLTFKGLFAANNVSAAFENQALGHSHSDYVIVEYSIDGGSYQPLLRFFANNTTSSGTNNKSLAEDTNGDGIGDGDILTTTFSEFSKSIPETGSTIRLRLKAYNNGGNEEWAVDYFQLESSIPSTTLATVTTTTASDITATTATLGGEVTDNGGDTVTERGIVYNTNGSPNVDDDSKVQIGSGDGSFSDEITGLTAGTQYYVRAYAINSEGTSYGSEESFTTLIDCPTVPTPIAVDFTGYSGINLNSVFPNWQEGQGDTPYTVTTSAWALQIGLGEPDNRTARVNLYTNTRNEWIIGPNFMVTTDLELSYDLAVTDWNSSIYGDTMGSDDKLDVLVSTDCGSSWTVIETYNASNNLSNTLTTFTTSLAAYDTQEIIVAFRATDGPVDDANDYDLHIDNIAIGSSCATPTAFALDNVTTESVDLTWTAGDSETEWEVIYGAPNFDPDTEGTTETVNDDPESTLDGLTAETDYEVYVRAVCGVDDESDWVGPESFTTLVACPTGDFTFTSQAQINNFGTTYSHCTDITLGNITVQGNDITNVDGLSNVTSTTGNLIVENNSQLTDITGFANMTSIGGNLKFEHNTATTSLSGFDSVETIGGYLSLWNVSMTSLQGLNHLTSVGGYLQISNNPLLEDFDGINALTSVNTNLFVEQNPVLENIDGLTNVTSIGGSLYINSNTALTDISGVQNIDPDTIGGTLGLFITNNTSLSVCNLPNLCTYLLGSGNRTIVNNLTECLNEAAVQAACGAELPFNQTQEIYTLTIQDAVEASDCDVQSTVVIPSGDYTTETVDTTAPCWDIFFTVGASPGCATIGSVTLDGSDTIEIEIEGLIACTEYDQYEITNDLTLGGAALDVQFLNGYEPDFEDSWIIYNNTFVNAVNGTFAGLAEGATFTVDGFEMQISYVGGDGNDIVLTATDCPDITTADVETNQEEDIVTDCEYEFTWTEPTFTGGCGITVTRTLDPVYAVSDSYVAGQVVTATTSVGVTTVTYTAEDDSGNEEVFEFTLTANDVTDPAITCTTNQTVDTDADVCTYTHSGTDWDATATDNCSVDTIEYVLTGDTTGTGTSLDDVVFNLGVTTVTWTATDSSTNTDVCSYTVTVEDNQDPEISCTTNQTVDTDADVCTYTHSGTGWDATATDNCSVDTIEYVLTGATLGNGTSLDDVVFNLGTTTVTWTATDGSTNTDVCSYTVTVEDNQDPAITCTTNQTVDTDTDVCTYTHSGTGWDATATDNCSVDTIEYVLTGATLGNGTSLDDVVFNLGTTTVTWTATDGSTNTDVCSYTVTVEDNQDPAITCTTNQTVDTDADVCTYTHSGIGWDATATDNCSVDTIEYVLTGDTTGTGTSLDGVTFNLGTTTVTWTATDGSNNEGECSFTVLVEDNQDPAITCTTNQTVDTDADVCTYTHSGTGWDATATDNCSINAITYTLSGATTGNGTSLDGVTFSLGVTTVSWFTTDGSGNFNLCSYTVTVEDNQAPAITCTTNQTVDTDADVCIYTHSGIGWDATSTDNCSVDTIEYVLTGATLGNGTSLDGVVFNLGTTTLTWTATDGSTNTDICSYTVTVEDNQDPAITCTTNQTVDTDADVCTYTHSGIDWDATATDNCSVDTIEYVLTGDTTGTGTSLDGVTFNLGTTTVTWTATDGSTNTDVCSYTVTVEDNQAPTAQCVADFTIALDENGQASIDVSDIDNGSNDACGIDTMTISQTDFDCAHVGDNVITLTVTDVNGNVSTCTTTVTVEDMILPEVVCAAPLTVFLDESGEASVVVDDLYIDATDNCAIDQVVADQTFFTCDDLGENTITVTATDVNGNSNMCTVIVAVKDDIAPKLECPQEPIEIDDDSYTVVDFVDEGLVVVSDNCAVASVTQDPAPGTVLGEGTHIITMTATDTSGHQATCSFEVIVDDGLGQADYDIARLTMYPNPANQVINISNPTGISIRSIAIYDLLGKRVQQHRPTTSEAITIDVSELPSAVYMVQIVADNGQQTYKRLVKDAK